MTVDYCVSIERHSIRGVTCCDSGLLCVYRETQYKRSYML